MQSPVVLVGLGEMGGVFAHGLLKAGHPVYPVTRDIPLSEAAAAYPEPALVLVTVGEDDLHPALEAMPGPWRDRVGLIQNELLPRDWQAHELTQPTVSAVWFEKKAGKAINPILASPVGGPGADILAGGLRAIGLEARELANEDELLFELVRKNLYILTINIAGLVTGGTTGELWNHHRELAHEVADDILAIQGYLVAGHELDRERLVAGMAEAMLADPEHGNTGRTAPARLRRALEHADAAGLEVPRLREIAAEHLSS